MHPLTKILYGSYAGSANGADNKIQYWANERAERLKKTAYDGIITPKMIDLAFQLEPNTLEDKFKAIQLKHNGQYHSARDFWNAVIKNFAQAADEHYKGENQ